jgi:hypothetical protein
LFEVGVLQIVALCILILLGDLTEHIAGNTFAIAIGVEESNHSPGLLEWLDQPIQ